MPELLAGLTKAQTGRVKRVVRAFEGSPDLTGEANARNLAPRPVVFARLTEKAAGANGYKFAWEEIRRTDTGWETVPEGLTGTLTERTAFEVCERTSVPVGEYVALSRMTVKASGGEIKMKWVFDGWKQPLPQYQHMVWKGTSNNQGGYGWVEAHALL